MNRLFMLLEGLQPLKQPELDQPDIDGASELVGLANPEVTFLRDILVLELEEGLPHPYFLSLGSTLLNFCGCHLMISHTMLPCPVPSGSAERG